MKKTIIGVLCILVCLIGLNAATVTEENGLKPVKKIETSKEESSYMTDKEFYSSKGALSLAKDEVKFLLNNNGIYPLILNVEYSDGFTDLEGPLYSVQIGLDKSDDFLIAGSYYDPEAVDDYLKSFIPILQSEWGTEADKSSYLKTWAFSISVAVYVNRQFVEIGRINILFSPRTGEWSLYQE